MTAIVHEAWLKLRLYPPTNGWQSRAHYFGAACHAMRQALVDQARRHSSKKRGGGRRTESLDGVEPAASAPEHVLMINDALEALAASEPRLASIAEMKLFGDLPTGWIAERLGVTPRTVQRDWAVASQRLRDLIGPL